MLITHLSRNLIASSLLLAMVLFSCEGVDLPGPDPEDPVDEPKTSEEIIAEYLTIDLNVPENYSDPVYPDHYNAQVLGNSNTPLANPITNDGAALGRVLFYDKSLSINNTIACASCHTQETGFTDPDRFSEGFDGGLTGVHSMRLGNTNFFTGARMFWDKRAEDLEDQSTQPIQDGIEMGFTELFGGMDSLTEKMAALPYYPILFEKAFGSEEISEERMQRALAQFIRSMVSVNSKFDDGYASVYMPGQPGNNVGADFPNYSAQENLGKRIFFAAGGRGGMGGGNSCNTCHQAPTFALGNNSRSNGLDAGETVIFKSPSLKNVAVAGGYMHDGRFATLREVVDHYADGIQTGPALDNRLRLPGRNGTPIRLDLTNDEREALVAFLETLTDQVLIEDDKFSDPFLN